MFVVIACLTTAWGLFALVALADQRHPDRLSRRGRHLAGIPDDARPLTRSSASGRCVSPSLYKFGQQPLGRLHFGAR